MEVCVEVKRCSRCKETKATEEFSRDRSRPCGLQSNCKVCQRRQVKEWAAQNSEHRTQYLAEYRAQPHIKARTKALDRARQLAKYGISLEEYNVLLAQQGGRCALCDAADAGRYGQFCVDHDHETGRVRGLLCHQCNRGLGLLCDDPDLLRAAADYIDAYR